MQFSNPEIRASLRLKALAFAGLLAAGLSATGCQEDDATGPASDAKITLTKPVGGETYKVGDSLKVTWTIKDDPSDPIDAVDVLLSPDDGMTWGYLRSGSITPLSASWQNFAWKIKDTLVVNTVKVALAGNAKCRVRVMQYSTADSKEISTSARAFSILAP